MDREILFRGFVRIDNGGETIWIDGKEIKGYWVYWDIIGQLRFPLFLEHRKDLIDYDYISKFMGCIIPETIGQYTGRKDRNGEMIFEGSILKVRTNRGETICHVVFRGGCFIGLTEEEKECDFFYIVYVEVIGNVYENIELMLGEENG